MKGILYGVGVGPGDPELMTLKAVRLIRETSYLALPGEHPTETVAYKIAAGAVPELKEKELIGIHMPMTHDQEKQRFYHQKGAALLESYLERGEDVVFLTLGDPTIYSTFSYLQHLVEADGYECRLISGVPSFCAAAARLGSSLAEWNESLHILPAVHQLSHSFDAEGNYVLMKSGKKIAQVKELLKDSSRQIMMVENCGMEHEKLYYGTEQIPDDCGYYALILAKEAKND